MTRRTEPQPALGRAIRRLRKERDLSQEELGHLAEIHPTWISHIESGRTNPAWGTVRRIAKVLDVRLSEIVLLAERIADEGES
ncbi:MAG TPA: helix-turn-helix transcriptional regulator [Solirubrobacterales bacterium]|nr:helix-turn-helix transcriptional regulator [Solirubrobacterales bacterium]